MGGERLFRLDDIMTLDNDRKGTMRVDHYLQASPMPKYLMMSGLEPVSSLDQASSTGKPHFDSLQWSRGRGRVQEIVRLPVDCIAIEI
jgi:hypothetical protein